MGQTQWEWPMTDCQENHSERAALLRPIQYEMTMPVEGSAAPSQSGRALSLNISRGGMLVLMDRPPAIDQVMKIYVPTPITGDGFYITGDVFRRDDNGFHYFVGRADDMFVSGGENIYPADVERMLERHPDVGQAVVVPVDDDIKGTKPVAFVIPKSGHQPKEDAIKKFALENAPAYQHPRFVWFVDDLPLASTNKVDRGALHRMAEQRLASRLKA